MQITRGVIRKPLRVVVYGPEGIGKTTFASRFPRPLFIDTENSSEFLDVARLPKPTSWTMLLREIDEARTLAGQFDTLVLDTADWAEALCKSEIISSKQLSGIEDIGYGRGYVYLAEKWGAMLNKLSEVRDAGMNVVITAHAALRKFEQPDELGAYDRYELKLEKKTAPILKEWSDMMLFANYETYIVKENGKDKNAKGKAQGGRRVMYTSHHPCWDAKNRQGLPEKLPFDFAEIARCLPEAAQTTRDPERAPRTAEQDAAEPEQNAVIASGVPSAEREAQAAPAAEQTVTPEQPLETPQPSGTGVGAPPEDTPPLPFTMDEKREQTRDTVPKQLQDLLDQACGICEADVRKVIADKGYFPIETPWQVMVDEGFVDGWVLPFWDKIVDMIKSDPGWLPF